MALRKRGFWIGVFLFTAIIILPSPSGLTESAWLVESMMTLNFTLGYKFKNGLRVRGQIRNLEDTRAPLADEYTWGFVGDVHSDYGRSYAIEFYQRF